jgi:hypothetical protein
MDDQSVAVLVIRGGMACEQGSVADRAEGRWSGEQVRECRQADERVLVYCGSDASDVSSVHGIGGCLHGHAACIT